jgi:hypothetical protein
MGVQVLPSKNIYRRLDLSDQFEAIVPVGNLLRKFKPSIFISWGGRELPSFLVRYLWEQIGHLDKVAMYNMVMYEYGRFKKGKQLFEAGTIGRCWIVWTKE